jgi:parvulin-like peptidyl-prolyl isomerase
MLLFTSNQAAVLITAPYPPYGLATISFMAISSYLILVGVYSSAISVAQDVNLRKSLRKSVEQQSTLLDKIGVSEMEQEIHRRVIKITKEKLNKMTEETGVQSSVTDDEMKQYMNDVLKEIKKT